MEYYCISSSDLDGDNLFLPSCMAETCSPSDTFRSGTEIEDSSVPDQKLRSDVIYYDDSTVHKGEVQLQVEDLDDVRCNENSQDSFLLEPTPIGRYCGSIRLVTEINVLPQEIIKNRGDFISVLSNLDHSSRRMGPNEGSSNSMSNNSHRLLRAQHIAEDCLRQKASSLDIEQNIQTFGKQHHSEEINEETAGREMEARVEFDDNNYDTNDRTNLRRYQNERWMNKYNEILEYHKINGHCNIPHIYSVNPPLGQWVKRQRNQYRLYTRGDHSHLNADRVKLLDDIGFIWDSHGSAWEDKYNELKAFKKMHGHFTVPCGYSGNRKLSTWVKRQRHQYRLFVAGKQSTMNAKRVAKLEEIDFVWDYYSNSPTCGSMAG